MAYKWPDLDPDEIADFSVDWSRFLTSVGGDTIASVVWQVNGETLGSFESFGGVGGDLMVQSPTNTDTVATVRFSSGINGTRYKVTCRITTTDGNVYERVIFLRVRSR